MKPKVIILTADNILATSLKHLLYDSLAIKAHIAADLSSPKVLDDFERVITTPESFVAHLSLLLPIKANCIIITDSQTGADGINSICRHSDESDIIDSLSGFLAPAKHSSRRGALSSREIDVLRLVASGLTNKEIAQQLYISVNTVLSHRKNITAKLGIKSVSGLSLYAMMNGLINP